MSIIGVPHAKGDPANWKGVLVKLSDRPAIRHLVDRVSKELVIDGMRSQLVGLKGSLNTTVSKKKPGSPTNKSSTITRTNADSAVKLVDVDRMLDMVYEVYLTQAAEEFNRIVKISTLYDIDDDKEISLNEFKSILNHCAPGKYTNRQLLHYFSRLSTAVEKKMQIEHSDKGSGIRRVSTTGRKLSAHASSPSPAKLEPKKGPSEDDDDGDTRSVTIEFVATWCLAMGIITPDEDK
jgi:hypothetical protein